MFWTMSLMGAYVSVFQILWRFSVACLMFSNAFGILNEDRFLAPRGYTFQHVQLLEALRDRDWRWRRNWRMIFKAALVLILYTIHLCSPLFIVFNTFCIAALLLFNSTIIKFNLYFAVLLLAVALCTYLKKHFPSIVVPKPGFEGIPWKAARIGERLSPWIAAGCLLSWFSIMFL